MELGSDNQRRALFTRIIASVLLYTVFGVLAVSWVLTQDETLKWALFIPLVAAVLVLPREVQSDDLADEMRNRLKLWLSYVRVAYFIGALIIMLGLPELLN